MTFTINDGILHLNGVSLEREATDIEASLVAQLAESQEKTEQLKVALDTIEGQTQKIDKALAGVRGVH